MGFLERLKQEWQTSAPEHVTETTWTKFAGFELQWKKQNSLKIAQPSYVRELLDRNRPQGRRFVPMSKLDPPEEESKVNPRDVKRAQALTAASCFG